MNHQLAIKVPNFN